MRVKLVDKNTLNDLITGYISKNTSNPEKNHDYLKTINTSLPKHLFSMTHRKGSNKNSTPRSYSFLQQPHNKMSLPNSSLLSPSLNAWLTQLRPPLQSRLFAEDEFDSLKVSQRMRFVRNTPQESEFEAYGKARLKLRQARKQKLSENHSQNKERIKQLFEQPNLPSKEHQLSKTNYDFKSIPREGKAFRVNNKLVVFSPEKNRSMTITGLRFYQTLYK